MKNFDSVITDREGTASENRPENNILNPRQSNNPQKQANHCKNEKHETRRWKKGMDLIIAHWNNNTKKDKFYR